MADVIKKDVLSRLPSSFLDNIHKHLTKSIDSEEEAREANSKLYLMKSDELARSRALISMGKIEAYKETLEILGGNNG